MHRYAACSVVSSWLLSLVCDRPLLPSRPPGHVDDLRAARDPGLVLGRARRPRLSAPVLPRGDRALPADVLQYSDADRDIARALAFARRGRDDGTSVTDRPRRPRRRSCADATPPPAAPPPTTTAKSTPTPDSPRPRRHARRRPPGSACERARRHDVSRRPAVPHHRRSRCSPGSCCRRPPSAGRSPADADAACLPADRIRRWGRRRFSCKVRTFRCRPTRVLAWPVRSQDARLRARRGE